MDRSGRYVTWGILLTIGALAPAWAQQSSCVDCHVGNRTPAFAVGRRTSEAHLRDWSLSAHSRAGIGCEKCHGGDPTTPEPAVAHRGILRWINPESSISRVNIPRTCGTCHAGPFAAFQKSRHFGLLQGRNPVVPTCTTCHGAAGEKRPSPAALERECASCHRPGRPDEHPEFPAMGGRMLEGVRAARTMLEETRSQIDRVKDQPRRARLEQAAEQVDVTLREATHAGHAFVYDDLEDKLNTAHRQLAALFDVLAMSARPR